MVRTRREWTGQNVPMSDYVKSIDDVSRFPVNSKHVKKSLLLTGVMCVAWLIQVHLIYPIESGIRGEGLVDVFSFLFLPHGFKIIILSLFPVSGFLPLACAQAFAHLYLGGGGSVTAILAFGLVGALSCAMPIWAVNLVMGRNWHRSPLLNSELDFNSFRFMLALVFVAALLNSIAMSAINNAVAVTPLPIEVVVGFVAGDLIGGCFVLVCFAFLGNRLLGRLDYGR